MNIDQPHTRDEWRELFVARLREDGMPPLAAARRVADHLDEQAAQNLNAMAGIGAAKVLVDAFYATIKHLETGSEPRCAWNMARNQRCNSPVKWTSSTVTGTHFWCDAHRAPYDKPVIKHLET